MAIDARLRELGTRHQSLERAIEEEMSHPAASSERLKDLKRQKLRLKEEMESLKAQIH
jgi:hypothetical protein